MQSVFRMRHALISQAFHRGGSFRPTNYLMSSQIATRSFFQSQVRLQQATTTSAAAMSGTEQDETIFYIQSRCTTVQRLLEYEQEEAAKLSVTHKSVLLARLRTLLLEQGASLNPQQRSMAQTCYQSTAVSLLKNVKELDCLSLSTTLNILSKGNTGLSIEVRKPDQNTLALIEQQVIEQYDAYIAQDISIVMTSLIRLLYTPKLLLELMNRMTQMSTFSKEACVRMLEVLVEDNGQAATHAAVKADLFNKFFFQLERYGPKLNSYGICRAFSCLDNQLKLPGFTDSKRDLQQMQLRAQFLVQRLSDMLSRDADVSVLDLYWSNKFVNNIQKVLTDKLGGQVGYQPLDLRKLQLYSVQELQEHLDKVDPKVLVNMMDLFENDKYRQRLVQKTLEGLRKESIDIRTFPPAQLAKFVTSVATYHPEDVKVFFNYIMTAFDSGFFSMTKGNFGSMSQIFVMFVQKGFLCPGQQNKFFFSYLLSLKNTILPPGGKEERLDSRDLIKVTWSLINMQAAGSLTIPLLPKLLEQLASFDRPEMPLTQEELLMLHQINVYVKDMVFRNRLPEEFQTILPSQVSDAARSAYQAWNQPLFPDVQKEIAVNLLKLRVEFKENTEPIMDPSDHQAQVLNEFIVPIRLTTKGEDSVVILLSGDENKSKDTQQWHGLHGFTVRLFDEATEEGVKKAGVGIKKARKAINVKVIDVNEWRSQDEVSRMHTLSTIIEEARIRDARSPKAIKQGL